MPDKPDDIPSWIATENEQKAAKAQAADEVAQREIDDSALIHKSSPQFWAQLVDRLGVNVKALPKLAGEELVGSVSQLASGGEENCHIQVNRQSVRFGPELSRMNLFYRPGGSRIRCWYQNQDAGDIELVRSGNEVRAIDGAARVTAHELADHLVKWMADRVKADRRG